MNFERHSDVYGTGRIPCDSAAKVAFSFAFANAQFAQDDKE
jgi:hypothetical protein